jgi:hypothetical protein
LRVSPLTAAHSATRSPSVSGCAPDWKSFKFSVRRHAKNAFENAMVAVTFAEAGQHDIVEQMRIQARDNLDRLIPRPEREGLEYHLTLKPGNPDDEILRYVYDHRDVILTIYDAAGIRDEQECRSDKKRSEIQAIAQKLPTPLVLRRGCEPTGLRP